MSHSSSSFFLANSESPLSIIKALQDFPDSRRYLFPSVFVHSADPAMDGDRQPAGDDVGGGGGGEERGKGVVVILVGAPGSGKTTFCDDVMRTARRPWARICQDTIANGKAGTKSQCLKTAVDSLKDGKAIFIDRCNLDREQRADFVKLGGPPVDVHAVVLDLPARLCISRSVKRTGHEGNLQGGKAAAVVNRMLQKKELPKLSEGFSRITFCQNESDVQDAVNTYSALGPSDTLVSGCFGQKNPDSKVQLGIMKFLKKVDIPNNTVSHGHKSLDSTSEQETTEKYCCNMEPEKECNNNEVTEAINSSKDSFTGDVSWSGVHTLAFPSISTADFQFNHEKASDIITESVADFLNKVDNVRFVLVDLSHGSNILSLVRAKAAKKNIDSNMFFTFVGDITRLFTGGNLQCDVIANAANWRLRPGGGGVNTAIFNAAGESLEIATKERAGTLSPGNSLAVPLPSTSPLYQREGVTHVIHVLGPNMNPQRPNCLKNDYAKGCKILRDAYSSLFENFASIVQAQVCQKEKRDFEPESSDPGKHLEVNRIDQFLNSDQKMKRESYFESGKNKKYKGDDCVQNDLRGNEQLGCNSIIPEPSQNSGNPSSSTVISDGKKQGEKSHGKEKKTWGSWAQTLHQIAMHPEQHKDCVIEISDDFVVLNDLYPKAKRHILVLSRLNGLDRLADVREEHLPLLKKMHAIGLKWAEKFSSEDPSLIFRLGYHSVPSMQQLHLHVVSQDFDSPHLKNKKHWNSFNSAFFRDSADAIQEVDKCGAASFNDESLLSKELRCHRCRSAHPNIPKLKAHISKCSVSFPTPLLQNGRLVVAPSRAAAAASGT